MIDRVIFEEAEYIGEVDEFGMPCGRGTLKFYDGRVYTGELDGEAQRGRGLWRYPDGSCLRGGFTLCRDTPAWVYTDGAGNTVSGIACHFVSEADGWHDAEADLVAIQLLRPLNHLGVGIEFNARALIVDAIMRKGKKVDEVSDALLAKGVDFITVPQVMDIL